ncbi:FERM domain-containing 5-like [Paramuricea clavata]|uniref:FERM domain-containing 5-like n=1 Tax=Paramuricea clavata TaxID=317549 RepID=A0A7D9KDN7_PARCT|nr:FERM domain-containing 5-like [Paramuricea clavata]
MSKFKRKRLVRVVSCKLTYNLMSEEVCYLLQIFYVWKMFQREANYEFRLPDYGACKHLWKCAIEHHTFYSNEIKPGRVAFLNALRTHGQTLRENCTVGYQG